MSPLYTTSEFLSKAPLTLFMAPNLREFERDGKILLHEIVGKVPLETLLQLVSWVEGDFPRAAIRQYSMWCASFARPIIEDRTLKQLLDVAQNYSDGLAGESELQAANEEARNRRKIAKSAFEMNSARVVAEATMPWALPSLKYAFSLELLCNAVDALQAAYGPHGQFKHFKKVQPLVLERTLKEGQHTARSFGFGLDLTQAETSLEKFYYA